MLLSSHLLSEVERICDAVAIVDRGRIVAQGRIADLSGRNSHSIRIGCDDAVRARSLLAALGQVARVDADGEALRVVVAQNGALDTTAAEINRLLVGSGIAVHRLEPEQASLEQAFLEITSRLEDAA